jgi:hypothetical protein
MATTPQFVSAPFGAITTFVNADGTNTKTLYTSPSGGCRVDRFFVTSDDTAARDIIISLYDGSTTITLDRVTLRPSTSTRVISNWNILDPNRLTFLNIIDPDFILPATFAFKMAMATAVTSGKTVSILIFGGTF